MLFKLSSNHMPTIYEKAEDREDALDIFKIGFDDPLLSQEDRIEGQKSYKQHIDDPSFKCEQITPQQFVDELPEEFQINDDVSF